MDKKRCSSCGEEKVITEFYYNAGTRDGYSSICKECQAKSSKKYAEEHKEELRIYKRERYIRRKEEFKREREQK